MDVPALPSELVTELHAARGDHDRRREARALRDARERGDAVVPDLVATLSMLRELEVDADTATELRLDTGDLLLAANATTGCEALVRDAVARDAVARESDTPFDAVEELLVDFESDEFPRVAVSLRAAAVTEDDAELRSVCAYLASIAAPGTPGVLDALLDEHTCDPDAGVMHLCAHGDDRGAPALLEWVRAHEDLDAIDDRTLYLFSLAAARLLEWRTPLDAAERARAEAVVAAECERLVQDNEELRDAVEWNERRLDELRALLPGRLRPAHGRRRTGPNDPCPCGSGKKAKKCCG